MPLERLQIKVFKDLERRQKLDEFTVLFNPTEYTVEDSNTWEEQKRERRKPELQFTGQALKKLSMDLFLDTYERKEDVRIHTNKLAKLLVVSLDASDGERPPVIELHWGLADPNTTNGIFPFVCVLESLKQQFTLFSSDGKPVRAKLTVSFKEFRSPTQQEQKEPRKSSFPFQTYTVNVGDTLSGIAATLWNDPLRWRLLAETNEIDNPRTLRPAQVLLVPEIRD